MDEPIVSPPRRDILRWPGWLIGFALGGFFDGILLHQILQWHHLLSLVDGVSDQVLFDGLFHALMYIVAGAGLVGLVRSRTALSQPGSGRRLLAAALVGAGLWHVLDGVLSHWLLGIHRIKLDSTNPLFWDVAWLVVFGVAPILLGVGLDRTRRGRVPGRNIALGLGVAALIGGGWAAQPPANADTAIVFFAPGTSQSEAVNAIVSSHGRLLWQSAGVWAVRWNGRPKSALLYRNNALFVSSSLGGAGCFAWSQ
jgi:uncharacterized membrane protein